MLTKVLRSLILISLLIISSSWGFFAHKKINHLAVFILPPGMVGFYKRNINFITNHAVDPDKRRYSDSTEASKHFLDADRYGQKPFDSIPQKWKLAVEKYTEHSLKENGIIPWQIERTYYSLVKAFQERDSIKILKYSADIGHYVGDAHVPLHTSENYNGQLTNQVGIHAFWESRLPELFSKKYDFLVGKAHYIENPLQQAFTILRHTYGLKDSVLQIEAQLNKSFRPDMKYAFSEHNGKIEKQYSEAYSTAYHDALNGMVEKQMRSAILEVGSFWYAAWVDAGQPELKNFIKIVKVKNDKKQQIDEDLQFNKGKIIGREEN